MKKTKFVLLNIQIKNGEYEYNSKSIHEISARKSLEKFGQDYAKDFYGSSTKPYQMNDKIDKNDWWYFNGGEVAVRIGNSYEITKEQYEVLKDHI